MMILVWGITGRPFVWMDVQTERSWLLRLNCWLNSAKKHLHSWPNCTFLLSIDFEDDTVYFHLVPDRRSADWKALSRGHVSLGLWLLLGSSICLCQSPWWSFHHNFLVDQWRTATSTATARISASCYGSSGEWSWDSLHYFSFTGWSLLSGMYLLHFIFTHRSVLLTTLILSLKLCSSLVVILYSRCYDVDHKYCFLTRNKHYQHNKTNGITPFEKSGCSTIRSLPIDDSWVPSSDRWYVCRLLWISRWWVRH